MARKVSSKLQQQHYGSYKTNSQWRVNRERRLLKLLAKHPNNKQLEQALKNIHYRRKTPKSPQWTKRTKYLAQLIKSFCGYCSPNVFNKNSKVSEQASSEIKTKTKVNTQARVSFKLGDRVRTGVLK